MEKTIYTHICQYEKCGKKFESVSFWARFCSHSHRQMAYANRQKEAEKQVSENENEVKETKKD